jgi:hypothetical protein
MLYRLYIYRLRGGTNTPFGTGLVAVFTKLGGARDISIITGEDRDIRIFNKHNKLFILFTRQGFVSAAVVKTYSCIAGLAATIIISRIWRYAP